MSFIYSLRTDVPVHKYDQYEVFDILSPYYSESKHTTFKAILRSTRVRQRYFSWDLEELVQGALAKDIERKFQIWHSESLEYLTKQVEQILDESKLDPKQIDGICVNTSTGVIIPGLDVLLADKFGFRNDIMRFPFFGYACTGGLIALNRMSDHLDHFTDKAILYCSTETSAPHLEIADTTNSMLHNSLFSDGFATALMVGKDHALAAEAEVEVIDTASELITRGKEVLRYYMDDTGLVGHLDASLPDILKKHVSAPFNNLLERNEIIKDDLDYIATHIGGPKIIKLLSNELDLEMEKLNLSYEVFRNYGNQSSVSVLNSLEKTLQTATTPGNGFMMAMGPGVSIEMTYCKLMPRTQNVKKASYQSDAIAV